MLKLKFSKPSIKHYNDGKITVCTYSCSIIENNAGNAKEVKCEFTSTGIAKCSPNDTVDLDFGRKLADSRAKLKAYKVASNYIAPESIPALVERINAGIELLKFTEFMRYLKGNELLHIQDLCEEMEK